MSNYVQLDVWFQEDKLSALSSVLVEQGTTVEKRMQGVLLDMYEALVPRETHAPALASVLRGTVQDTENRICRLLFKLAVELDMVMNVLAAGMEISDDALRSLRGRCVQNVKKTSGSVTLDKAVEYQRGGV